MLFFNTISSAASLATRGASRGVPRRSARAKPMIDSSAGVRRDDQDVPFSPNARCSLQSLKQAK